MCYRKVRHPAVYGGGAPCTAVPRDDQGPAGHGGGEDLSGAGKSEARWSSYLSHARTVLKYASAPFLGRKNRNYDPRPRILLWSKETPPKFAVRRAQSRANIGFTSLGYLYASDFRSRPPAGPALGVTRLWPGLQQLAGRGGLRRRSTETEEETASAEVDALPPGGSGLAEVRAGEPMGLPVAALHWRAVPSALQLRTRGA